MADQTSSREAQAKLHERLHSLRSICVALSGGLDSRFLCREALQLGIGVQALHVTGPHIPARETAWTEHWAALNKLPLTLVAADPLDDPLVAENSRERCYHCKKALFAVLQKATGDTTLCDGTNASDADGYRPGLRALREAGIVSPLAEAGLAKTDIRALARESGMDRPEQAAQPCLFTRFNYGIRPTCKDFAALDTAEAAVEQVLRTHSLFVAEGVAEVIPFRLRIIQPGETALHLRLAALPDAAKKDLHVALAAHGFEKAHIVPLTRLSGYFDGV